MLINSESVEVGPVGALQTDSPPRPRYERRVMTTVAHAARPRKGSMMPDYEPGQMVALTSNSPWYRRGLHFARVHSVGYRYVSIVVPAKRHARRSWPERVVRIHPEHIVTSGA